MYWLDRLFRKEKTEKQLDRELRFHLEQQISDYIEAGMDPEKARRRATIEFGGMESVKEECRESRWVHLVETALQDVRYGLRLLRRSPGFTLVAVITLMLGIGANTAIFSVVKGVLLDPLPYPHPEQLVTLHMSKPNFETGAISFPNFRDWQAQNHTFSAMALSRVTAVNLIGQDETEHFRANLITSDFFPVLGVQPVVGRNFAPGEDDLSGPSLVQISEGLWKRKFGGRRDILETKLNLSGKLYSVVGVVPASFDLALINFAPTDIYLPMGQWGNGALKMRKAPLGLHGIGRIKPGVTLEQARADMERVSRNLADAYPDTNRDNKANLIPLKPSMTGQVQPVLLLLLSAVAFVLLIACVNVANLLLARSHGRMRELAVRAALGANRTRLLRQLLSESVVLALAGGAGGVLLAAWATSAAIRALPQALPRASAVHLDVAVLLFTAVLSILSAIAFGLVPALKTSRVQLQEVLQSGGRGGSGERHRTQRILVATEIATALVLLTGAGLMVRSMARLWKVEPGFDPHNLVIFRVSMAPSMDKAAPAAVRTATRELHDALSSAPGVEAVSFRNGILPMRSDDELLFWKAGQPQPYSDSEMDWALRYRVQPDYLRVMKTPLVRGRFFGAQDNEKSPPAIVVDDVLAATFFPNIDPLGQRIRWLDNNVPVEGQIVGVVGHVKQWGLDNDDSNSLRAQVYQCYNQLPDDELETTFGVSLRTSGPPLSVIPILTQRVQQLSSEDVLFDVLPMDEILAQSLLMRKLSMVLLALFAGLALLLAAVGIYGVVAYLAAQRTREFGIRMALGAQRSNLLGMVLGQGAGMVLAGLGCGLLASFVLTRLITKMLFGVQPTDPLTFSAVAALLVMVALVACTVPAHRATRIDPMKALRYE